MFELLLYVMDRFLNLRDTDAERAIALLPSKVSEPMYGQRRSRISGFRTGTRSFVLKTQ